MNLPLKKKPMGTITVRVDLDHVKKLKKNGIDVSELIRNTLAKASEQVKS